MSQTPEPLSSFCSTPTTEIWPSVNRAVGPQKVGQAEIACLSLESVYPSTVRPTRGHDADHVIWPLVWPFTVPVLVTRGTMLWKA